MGSHRTLSWVLRQFRPLWRVGLINSYVTSCVLASYAQAARQGEFIFNRKQVVNRPKVPQGLSTLLFYRWSEVPSRGGVPGDSP